MIIGIIVVVAVLAILLLIPAEKEKVSETSEPVKKSVKVQTVIAQSNTLTQWVHADGVAQARQKEFLVFERPGVVSTIGQESDGTNLREGSVVKGPSQTNPSGQLLAELDNRDIKAQLASARANLSRLNNEFQRAKKLFDENISSELEFEQAKAQYQVALAEVESLEVQLDRTRLYAPFDGRIAVVNVKEGTFVSGGIQDTQLTSQEAGAAFVVIDDSEFEILVNLPAYQAGIVQREQRVLVGDGGDAIASYLEGINSTDVFEGQVWSVSPSVNLQQRSITVRARLAVPDNKASGIKDGMFVSVWIAAEENSNALTLPYRAVNGNQGNFFVYVLNDQNIAQRRPVTLGLMGINHVEISNGLQRGDVVISAGQHLLSDGGVVEVISSSTVGLKAVAYGQ